MTSLLAACESRDAQSPRHQAARRNWQPVLARASILPADGATGDNGLYVKPIAEDAGYHMELEARLRPESYAPLARLYAAAWRRAMSRAPVASIRHRARSVLTPN